MRAGSLERPKSGGLEELCSRELREGDEARAWTRPLPPLIHGRSNCGGDSEGDLLLFADIREYYQDLQEIFSPIVHV